MAVLSSSIVLILIHCHTGKIKDQVMLSTKLQWATKMLRHLAAKFDFRASWTHLPPSPPNNVDFSIS